MYSHVLDRTITPLSLASFKFFFFKFLALDLDKKPGEFLFGIIIIRFCYKYA